MSVELLEIQIPAEFLTLCREWAGGTDCMLRAIDSTGSLTLGTNRPWNYDADRPMNDHEWHRSLFSSLEADIYHNRKLAEKSGHDDSAELWRFECWAEDVKEKMDEAYKDVMYQD